MIVLSAYISDPFTYLLIYLLTYLHLYCLPTYLLPIMLTSIEDSREGLPHRPYWSETLYGGQSMFLSRL